MTARAKRGFRRGSALLMALWMIAVLSIMVLSFAFEAHQQSGINVYVRERNRVNRLVEPGRILGETVLLGFGDAKEWSENEKAEDLDEEDRWYKEKRALKFDTRCTIGPILMDEEDEESGTVTVDIEMANSGSANGININDHCGALYPETMSAKVKEVRADLGIALDGDADRLIMADEHGHILDGDQLMAMCAQHLMEHEALPGNAVVATAMSNLALELFMKERGGRLLRSKVGDRYVMEMMRREGVMFGGEQSGHLIFRQFSTTGDGLLAALQVLHIMREKERPLSEISGLLTLFPQKLVNVHVEKKLPFEERPAIGEAVRKVEEALAGRGRVLLRYSGTESLCRVMVEAEDEVKVEQYAQELAGVVQKELAR